MQIVDQLPDAGTNLRVAAREDLVEPENIALEKLREMLRRLRQAVDAEKFADDHEERDHIAAAVLERGRRVLGKNLQPQAIVVIGDTPFDVRCGKFIGAKTLAVATGGAKLEELKKCDADWAVADLTQISAREICA